jgi:hypothetical protein
LIDLTTDGWALSNSKGRNPCHCKSRDDPLEAEIFYESDRLQQNTVNDDLSVRPGWLKTAGGTTKRAGGAIRLMAGRNRGAQPVPAQLSTLPNPRR